MARTRKRLLQAADLFCGGGGFTTGAESTGRVRVALAINHWRTAIFTHERNHPETRHICARIDDVDPRNDKTLPELDLLLASPECTHHSIARGGRPIDDQKRATPWHVCVWAEAKRPADILIENVREFRDWGPLDAACRPVKAKKGEIFRQWIKSLEAIGYVIDHQILNAADFGAATKRLRLFIHAVRDDIYRKRGRSIAWPEPSHAGAWRPAFEIIDWAKPCPSIFGRKRPLAEKTLRRIELGLRKFVGQPEPFVVVLRRNMDGRTVAEPLATVTAGAEHQALAVPFQFKARGCQPGLTKGIDTPVPTIMAARDNHAIMVPYLVPNFGERHGQDPRTHSISEPTPTVTGHGAGALAMPFFLPRQGFYDCHKDKPPASIEEPLGTVTANHGPGQLIMPFIQTLTHGGRERSISQPFPTITTANRGEHGIVTPFLAKYYGTGGAESLGEPIDTVTTRDRFGLCQAWLLRDSCPPELSGDISPAMASLLKTMRELGVYDIGFRMLEPDELARAQGFPEGYYLHGTRADQVRQVGNAVCPPVARALCETIAEAA
jgi:DNA (cytosine-5)-methyltransferase 1